MSESLAETRSPEQAAPRNDIPGLYVNRSFWGLTATQFLGAFNDNLFKQIVLLLLVAVPTASGTRDLQWLGTFMFSVPFILFSGYAGYLSDRFSKRRVIVLSKVAEIVIMAIGALLFLAYARYGMTVELLILLSSTLMLMGAQSAFFGPGKYGILPEMLREQDLPRANGFILMTTFLAIIFGTALAGVLLDYFPNKLWVSGSICVLIAMAGTGTSLIIRRVAAAQPGLPFDWSAVTIPREMRRTLLQDRPLLAAVIVSTIFWMGASMVVMAVNSLGDRQLLLDKFHTSLLVAITSVGIAVGSVLAGIVSRQRFDVRVLKIGAWGLVICLTLLALPGFENRYEVGLRLSVASSSALRAVSGSTLLLPPPIAVPHTPHLLGFGGSLVTLVFLGGFTGMFAVPLQVYLQARPPAGQKGRMIATQNLLNWVGITLSSAFYWATDQIIQLLNWPRCAAFAVIAAMFFGVAIGYRGSPDLADEPAEHE